MPEAAELEGGHVAHGEPMNPMTGEAEDTDVGFPGPEHHVAERSWPMKAAMGPLALLVDHRRLPRRPGLSDVIEQLPRADLRGLALPRHRAERAARSSWGWPIGGVIAIAGIALAWWIYSAPARHDRAPASSASPRLHGFLVNKWYFDELYDAALRAARWRPSAASAGA